MRIPRSFILIYVLFDEAFKYGDVTKSLIYVETNAEQLRVEICNFVRCYICLVYFN
jgi:hypothetical protein